MANALRTRHWVYLFLVALVGGIASFAIGLEAGRMLEARQSPGPAPVTLTVNEGIGKPAEFDLTAFWEAYRVLRERFVDQEKLQPRALMEGAIGGLVSGAGDPYTVYVPPADQEKFVQDLQGSFGGIGAEIGIRKGLLVVIAPLEGTPADRAGLKAGDRILKINDTIADGLSVDEAVQLIRGPVDTTVTLMILPEGLEETKEVSIIRKTIVVPSLKWEVKDGVGVLRLLNFTADAGKAFAKAAREARKLPLQKLIIDVRNNPGGYLDVAEDIASHFLPRGEVIVYEVDAAGNRTPSLSRGYGDLEGLTVIVLMNQGSASASEILAGALRDVRGVRLVGEKSYGKGSVQELVNLPDGSVMKVTTAKWLTPNGTSINDEGLVPDVTVELPESPEEGKDVQMEKALELLK